ncbi:Antigen -like protein [Halotydeus destructor]|nr:Antigen -like protein [Halotydeus destructor]
MTNYGYLSPSSPSNGHHNEDDQLNGFDGKSNLNSPASPPLSGRQIKLQSSSKQSSCCGLTANFIVYVLFIFNFILLTSGAVILVTTVFYRSGLTTLLGENMEIPAIRSILPMAHPLNLVYYSSLICGLMICIISVMSMVISCRRISSRKVSYTKQAKRISQEEEFDMEIATDDEDDEDDDLEGFDGLAIEEVVRMKSQRRGNVRSSRDDNSVMSSCFLCCFIFALLFLFTIQLSIAVMGFLSVTDVTERHDAPSLASNTNLTTGSRLTSPTIIMATPLLESLQDTVGTENNTIVLSYSRAAFDVIEQKYKCCGLVGFEDYNGPTGVSCCKTMTSDTCGHRLHPSNIYYDGCVDKMDKAIKEQLLMMASLALGLSFVEIFGLLFSCCLYVLLLSSRDTVTEVRL